jgi:hypothetical protein
MQTFAGLLKNQKEGKSESRRQSAVDSQNNGNVEVNQKSNKRNAGLSSVTRPFRAFHNWCNNIK